MDTLHRCESGRIQSFQLNLGGEGRRNRLFGKTKFKASKAFAISSGKSREGAVSSFAHGSRRSPPCGFRTGLCHRPSGLAQPLSYVSFPVRSYIRSHAIASASYFTPLRNRLVVSVSHRLFRCSQSAIACIGYNVSPAAWQLAARCSSGIRQPAASVSAPSTTCRSPD